MNDFKERIKVERSNVGEIIITDELKRVLIRLMKGEITKQEAILTTGIGDKGTIERKIQELVSLDPRLIELYNEYVARKSKDFNGYTFRAEAIDMLRNDCSQSLMAERIGVNRRSFSTKIKKLQEENADNELGVLLKEHAERKMKRRELSTREIAIINCILDEYEEKYPVGTARYEHMNIIELRLQTLSRIIETVDELISNGATIKDLSQRKIISESSYRKYKIEVENLSKILNVKDLNKDKENGVR